MPVMFNNKLSSYNTIQDKFYTFMLKLVNYLVSLFSWTGLGLDN